MMLQRSFAGPKFDKPVTFHGGARRVNHGAVAWSVPSLEDALRQPQDGVSRSEENRAQDSVVQEINARSVRPAGEPEDARLTGGTRSLMRRVMGLNVAAVLEREPRKAAKAVRLEKPRAQVA